MAALAFTAPTSAPGTPTPAGPHMVRLIWARVKQQMFCWAYTAYCATNWGDGNVSRSHAVVSPVPLVNPVPTLPSLTLLGAPEKADDAEALVPYDARAMFLM